MTVPADFTPAFLKSLDGQLFIWCETCRVTRQAHLLAFQVAGRENQPIRTMKFRCEKCGTQGQAKAEWFDGEQRTYEFSTGKLGAVGKLPSVY